MSLPPDASPVDPTRGSTLPWLVAALAALPLASCLLGPRFEAIDPEYGYVDGCTDVVIQGAALGEDAEIRIGGQQLLDVAPAAYDSDVPEHAQDVGFKYFGVTPPAEDGAAGYRDVVVKTGDAELVLTDGFYYVACPAPLTVDSTSADGGTAAPGAEVTLFGCGIDAPLTTGTLYSSVDGTSVGTFPLTQVCGTARVSFTVPAGLPDGDYWLGLLDTSGNTFGGVCPGSVLPPDDTDAPVDTDTDVPADTDTDVPPADTDATDPDSDAGDTAHSGGLDTGDPCAGYILVSVAGGA